MRGSGLAAVVTVAAMLVAACTADPAPLSEKAGAEDRGMRSYLDGLVEVRQFRGSVEVRRGDEVLLRQGFSEADVAHDVPNGPDTRFRIGSLTKQFTGLAVLLLQEEGELQVSDPVCTHLPECPATWRTITVEQLLTHTSGLFDYGELTDAEIAEYLTRYDNTPTPKQLTEIFVDRPLEFTPGSKWQYSNCGYDLLGIIVERLSGQTYGEFLHDRIFGPLGMSDTAYQPEQQVSDHDATGYRGWTTSADVLPDAVNFASGGIYSTVTDLSRWNQFLLDGDPAVAEPDTLAQLLQPRIATPEGGKYGYGIETRGTGDAATLFHGGMVTGFATYSQIRPATGLSVVVLSNLDTVIPGRIADTLATLAET